MDLELHIAIGLIIPSAAPAIEHLKGDLNDSPTLPESFAVLFLKCSARAVHRHYGGLHATVH